MNRNLTKLRAEQPDLYADILKRMMKDENWSRCCRYSWGDVCEITEHLKNFEMTMTVQELNIFRSRLNPQEMALVERMLKSPASAEQTERDCKTAGMRFQRLMDSVLETYEEEKKLEAMIEEQQAKLRKPKADKQASWEKLRAIF